MANEAAFEPALRRPLEDFIRALRASEVRVSPAEAIDAHRAMAEVGFGDRGLLKDALCVTLAKSGEEVERFDACFDTFFVREEFTDGEAGGAAGEGADLAQMLLANDQGALAQALEAAGNQIGAGDIQLGAQRALITRRMLDQMGLRTLEASIASLRDGTAPEDPALADRLTRGRETLFTEANRFVERQATLHAAQAGRRLRERILERQSLTSIGQEDIRAMEALTRRMAKRLASRYTRKRHKERKGRLDVRRTLRRSLGYGGVPFDIVWKSRTVEKPKIVVICDVSRSVASAARFLLLLLYSLHDAVERLDAFAFSDRLESVNDLLAGESVDNAIALILARIGFRPTDYGRALEDLMSLHGERIDRRTTVIILGDGRSNYADPRLDILRAINGRARAVVWLNPEPETYWNQGDSRMSDYRRFCHVARTCNTLAQLERIIEDVLRTYLPR